MANTIQPNNNTSLYNSGGNAIPISANVVANNIAASGNVTVGGFIIANGTITTNSNFVGDLVGNVDATNIETGTVSATGNIETTGFFIGDGSLLTNLPSLNYSNANVANYLPVYGGNIAANSIGAVGGISAQGNILSFSGISAAGNITGNYFFGNGSQLTGLPQSYSDANVTTLLANFGSNTISSTGNISAGAITAQGNVTGNYFFGNGSQLTGLPQSYSNANVAAYLPVYSGNIAADTISATGNVTGLNLKTSGLSGNIVGANYVSAQFYLGDGGLLSNIGVGAYSNANVATFLNDFGANAISTSGNVTSGNLRVTSGSNTWTVIGSRITAPAGGQWFSDAGNLDEYINSAANGYLNFNSLHANGQVATNLHLEQTIAHIDVDGSLWTFNSAGNLVLPGNTSAINYANGVSILAGISGSYSNANVANYLPTFSGNLTANTISATGNVITSQTMLATQGFETSDTLQNNVTLVKAGNIQLTTDTGVSQTAFLNAGLISTQGNIIANGNITGGNIRTGGVVSATGNVTAGNIQTGGLISAAGNVTAGNITGSNGGILGSMSIIGNIINNINSFQSNANPNPGRILFGAGRNGNYNPTVNTTSSRVLQVDEIIKYDDGLRTAGITATLFGNLSGGNIGGSNANSRLQASQSELVVVSGNAVNNNPFTVRGFNAALQLGFGANTNNAFVQSGAAASFFTTIIAGSSANTIIGALNGTTFSGNVANNVGFYTFAGGTSNVTGNCYGFYMPGTTTSIGGQNTGNGARSATNYYFVRNDDDLAKSRLGSLELYHNFTANTANTTGTINIDKNNGQWQQIYPTGNITIGTLSNFVTRTQKPDATQVNQTDVVTLLIQQGATPYTVTMPTGNANIKYANSTATVANTANATTKITITGTYNYNVAGNQYLISIDPEYITV
jgi:hypothetical protein